MASAEVEVYDGSEVTLFGTANPAEVVERAAVVAAQLADLVRRQRLTVTIGRSEHVRVEGWTLLGSMLGVFPVVTWTRPVLDAAGVQVGWEARVEARTRSGQVVGAAESECLRSEKPWSYTPAKGAPRDDYALRSMAQTRAVSKALRLPLGFVMQLAGFDPTPADEMPREERPPRRLADDADLQAAVAELDDDGSFPPPIALVTQDQIGRLFTIGGALAIPVERLREIVFEVAGVKSTKLIPRDVYDAVIAAVEAEVKP